MPDWFITLVKSKRPYKLSLLKLKLLIFEKSLPLISIVLMTPSDVNPVYDILFPATWVVPVPLYNFQETLLDPEVKVMVGSKDEVEPLFWKVKTFPILFLELNCCLLIKNFMYNHYLLSKTFLNHYM